MNRSKRNILTSIAILAAEEDNDLSRPILAPALGGAIQVRLANFRCTLRTTPTDFRGWGLFRATSYTTATLARPATLAERRRYLSLFPAICMVAHDTTGNACRAIPADPADPRLRTDGPVPVALAADVDTFDAILARFDGQTFWFDSPDDRADPAVAADLRRNLARLLPPAALARPGISGAQRSLYQRLLRQRLRERTLDERQHAERRLRRALAHGGARLHDLATAGDHYRVTYTVDGHRHTSLVRRDDLTVTTSGICLSGQDAAFDLTSLVGVLRESRSA